MPKVLRHHVFLIVSATFLLGASLLLLSSTTQAAGSNRLRDLAAQKNRLFGFAAGAGAVIDPLQANLIKQEASIFSAENNLKWFCLHPQPGANGYNWNNNDFVNYTCSSADADVDFATANGIKMHGHTLVWHEGLPDWVKALPANQLEQTLYNHIDTVVGRYRGRIQLWDVVNEAIKSACATAASCGYRDQSDPDPQLRSIWYGSIGPNPYSYIVKAFQRAQQADPQAILLYNDFGIETMNPKSDFLYTEVKRWRKEGAPIHVIGFQAHVGVDFNGFQSFANNMKRFAKLGLDIYITELDVAVENSTQYGQQAEVYRRIVETCLAQSRCKGIQTWGIADRYSWLNHAPWAGPHVDPLLFNECFQPKPAYQAVQAAFGGQPDAFVMLQAEGFATQNNVCTEAGQPGVCGGGAQDPAEFIYNVDGGDWIRFTNVNLAAGFTTLQVCYARDSSAPAGVEMRVGDANGPLLATFNPANTNGWNNFAIGETAITGGAGSQALTFKFTGSGVGNLDAFVLTDANVAPPVLTLEAEQHNGQQGVDTYPTIIGYVDGGDWIKFDNVNLAGDYRKLRVRYAKGNTTKTGFEIRLDSPTGTRLAKFTTKKTGSWDNYTEKPTNLAKAAGLHTLYVVFTGGGGVGNFDWFRLEQKGVKLNSAGVLEADLALDLDEDLTAEEAEGASYLQFLPLVNR